MTSKPEGPARVKVINGKYRVVIDGYALFLEFKENEANCIVREINAFAVARSAFPGLVGRSVVEGFRDIVQMVYSSAIQAGKNWEGHYIVQINPSRLEEIKQRLDAYESKTGRGGRMKKTKIVHKNDPFMANRITMCGVQWSDAAFDTDMWDQVTCKSCLRRRKGRAGR